MSSSIPAARRRRRFGLASSFLAPIVLLGGSAAQAQQAASTDSLPPIEISPPVDQNRTRAQPTYDESSGPRRAAPNTAPTSNTAAPGTGSNSSTTTSSSDGNRGPQSACSGRHAP